MIYTGEIIILHLKDDSVLTRPRTMPSSYLSTKRDQILACATNERDIDDINYYEFTEGTLQSKDDSRPMSMKRWLLLGIKDAS